MKKGRLFFAAGLFMDALFFQPIKWMSFFFFIFTPCLCASVANVHLVDNIEMWKLLKVNSLQRNFQT